MVKVIAPLGVKTVPACLLCFHDPWIIQITFRNQHKMLAHSRFKASDFTGNLFQKVGRRAVDEGVHSVEAQAIHVVVAQAT